MNMRAFLLGTLTLCSTSLYMYSGVWGSTTHSVTFTRPTFNTNEAKQALSSLGSSLMAKGTACKEQAASWLQYVRENPQVIREAIAQGCTHALDFAKEHKTELAIGVLCAAQIALLYKFARTSKRVQKIEETQSQVQQPENSASWNYDYCDCSY